MNRALLLALAALPFIAACGEADMSDEEVATNGDDLTLVALPTSKTLVGSSLVKQPAVRDQVKYSPTADLNAINSALGYAILACKGYIAKGDLVFDGRQVISRVRSCPNDPRQLENIKNYLGIQGYKGMPEAPDYFSNGLAKWEETYRNQMGPYMRLAQVINPPSRETVKLQMAGRVPAKTNHVWKLDSPNCKDGDTDCAIEDAKAALSLFGPDFYVSGDPEKGVVVTDPTWYLDNTVYKPNPFHPTYGYQHPMAQNGHRYGALNRGIDGEYCTYLMPDGSAFYYAKLKPILCGEDWYCLSKCDNSLDY